MKNSNIRMKIFTFLVNILFLTGQLTLAGCACVDPLEPVNRKIFAFNMVLDRAFFRPVAKVYDKIVPAPVSCAIGNFFDNIDDVTNIANNTLQLKFYDAWSDVWRVGFNTTFGLFGLFDVATCAGLPKHHQDFGLTLARYGYVRSTYLMVPFLGPSTLRDSIGWSIDWRYLSVWPLIEPTSLRYSIYGLRLVHKRALFLPADKLVDEALDPYIFVRDAYLQKRDGDVKCVRACINCPEATGETKDAAITTSTSSKDPNDTFVPEDDANVKHNPTTQDPNDPFVAEDEGNSPAVKKEGGSPPALAKSASSKSSGDDPFVEP